MTKKLLFFLFVSLLVLSCKKSSDEPEVSPASEITLSLDYKLIDEGTFTVDVTADGSWVTFVDKPWVTLSQKSGEGNASVDITVEKGGYDEAVVRFISGENVVSLEIVRKSDGSDDTHLFVSPSLVWKTGAGTHNLVVNSASDWTATSSVSWLTVSPTSGSAGKTTVTISWPNGEKAEATVTFRNKNNSIATFSLTRMYDAKADIPTGAINGKFSVSPGTQVYFSQGNLQYHCQNATWRFAPNQYDAILDDNAKISASYNGYIDLFGWGATGKNRTPLTTSSSCSSYARVSSIIGTDDDWGHYCYITNGGERGVWRSLSSDEILYLLQNRPNADLRRALATVNGVKGLLLLPDVWTGPTVNTSINSYSANKYNTSQWSDMQSKGAVFLPVTGCRNKTSVKNQTQGHYWSGSNSVWIEDQFFSHELSFQETKIFLSVEENWVGYAVRLVQTVK